MLRLKFLFPLFLPLLTNSAIAGPNCKYDAHSKIVYEGKIESINYDWRNRYPRQDTTKMYIENGSFYMFRPDILRQYKNRLGGRIGMVEMEFWKMFEIDNQEELRICSTLMKEFLVEKR